ncbi:MAG: PRC-barrel domain-containing protein [Pseudomonadota bacterium]
MRQLFRSVGSGALAALLWFAAGVQADVSKASDWLGQSVVTQDGEPLGRIEDMAVDIESARVVYLVVSVGSFLIDDALIAVDPDALGPSADGQHLVLNSADLKAARRFNADSWPAAPDVLAAASEAPAPFVDAEAAPARTDPQQGRAFISDGRRQGTVEGGERRIEPVQRRTPAPAPAPARQATGTEAPRTPAPEAVAAIDAGSRPLPPFAQLDANGDGVLDRSEFGAYLGLKERYVDIDVDGSGRVDSFEYELLKDSRAARR